MQSFRPHVRMPADILELKAGNRFKVPAQIGRESWSFAKWLQIQHHWERLDDRRLPLLGPAKLLLGAQALGVGAQVGVEQGLLLPGLALDLLGLGEQVDEDGDLRSQDERVDWFEYIIDGAHRIATQQMLLLL